MMKTPGPAHIFGRRALRLWLMTLLSLLWFDVCWCLQTTFTAFSMAETWVNALLLSSLLSFPALVFDLRRTQAVIVTLLCLLLEANLLYSRTYFSAIPLSSYLLASNLGDFTASVTDSLRWPDLGFAAVVAGAWTFALRRAPRITSRRRSRVTLWALATGILALVSGILIAARGGYAGAWRSLENANYYSCRTPMYTVAGWLVHDASVSLAPLSDADRAEVEQWITEQPHCPTLPDSVAAPRSVILILCESLESWPIGLTLEGREITPVLNSLVADTARTLYAPEIVTQVGAGRSIDGQLLIMTGLQPMLSGVYAMSRADNEYPSLIKAMRPDRSYLLTVDKPVTWNQAAVARAFGTDTLISRDSWINDEPVGSRRKLGDRSFMSQIASKMSAGEIWPEGERAFIEIVTYSGHNPFVLPPELDSLRLKGDYMPVVRDYLTMARYTDSAIGRLLSYLRSRPDYASTMIVITGDHEGLAAYRQEAASRHPFVSPRQVTPLIVVNAPVGAGLVTRTGGQADIYSTLLHLTGLSGYGWQGTGMSLADPAHPGVAVGSRGDVCGDSTALKPHRRNARIISDRIINYNLLHK